MADVEREIKYEDDIFVPFNGRELTRRHRTGFFETAEEILAIKDLSKRVSRTEFSTPDFSGAELALHLPSFPEGVGLPKIIMIETPESNAMIIGRWQVRKGKPISFVPTRLDTGFPVQQDIAQLTRQLVSTPAFQEILNSFNDIEKEVFITDLIRDAHIGLQETLYDLTGETVPKTQLNVHHEKDNNQDNPFGRYPKDGNGLKLEGIDPENCRVLMICDPFASGMQQCKALEEHLAKVKQMNKGKHAITDLVVFAPIATLEGSAIISTMAAREGVRTTIFTSGAVLHARNPEMYWCPFFENNDQLIANPWNLELVELIEGFGVVHIIDRWCNWAAKRMAPKAALADSESFELSHLGLTNEEFRKKYSGVTPKLLRSIGMDPLKFVSYATFYEASALGRLPELVEFLKN